MSHKQESTNILIVNLHSSQNAGDAALLRMAVWQLRDAFPTARITLAINDVTSVEEDEIHDDVAIIPSFMALFGPSGTEGSSSRWHLGKMACTVGLSLVGALWHRMGHQVPQWLPGGARDLVMAYGAADLVVSCPGNIFFTMGRVGLPFLVSAFTVAYGLLLGRPLYVMPQSIGPLRRKWERLVVRFLYSRARLVFVREPVSFRLVTRLGVPRRRVRLTPDVAFNFPPLPLQRVSQDLRDRVEAAESPRLGLTVINSIVYSVSESKWKTYAESVAGALSRFLNRYGGSGFFYPQVTGPTAGEDDREMARRVIAQMPSAMAVELLDVPTSPDLLKALYGQMDLFVATRMHSGILALTMGVPTLFISYLHKTQGLVEMLEMEEWVLNVEEITEDQLWEKIEALWLRRDSVREKIRGIVPRLQRAAADIGRTIAEDYLTYERQEK